MLELKNINLTFYPGTNNEKRLFQDFSLSLPQGEFVTIIGGNGSGKTSLLNLICGSIKAQSGQIILDGEDISQAPEHHRYQRIGRVFQDPSRGVASSLTLIENLALAENKNKPFNFTAAVTKEQRESFQQRLSVFKLGLENKLDEPVGMFSGGERQAVALLMATVTPIDYLILDEHTAALDPKAAETIMRLTAQIVEMDQLSVIMVTHDLQHAIEYGDRLLVLNQGALVLDLADPEQKADLLKDPEYLDITYSR